MDLADFFEYRVGASQLELAGPPYGGFRYPIEARIASRTFEKFHVDIGIGDICIEPLEQLQGKGYLEFCGIPTPIYRVISAEQQFAEKIHAYTLPRELGYNSRVKDLIDMVLLIQLNQMNSQQLMSALQQTFRRRQTHPLPTTLALPPPEWKSAFATLAAQCKLTDDIEAAVHLAANLYAEVMSIKSD
jgi:hypothetical protein